MKVEFNGILFLYLYRLGSIQKFFRAMLGRTCSCSSTCFTIIDYLEDSEGYLFNLRRVGWNQLSIIRSHECSTGSHIKAAQDIPRNIHWPVSFIDYVLQGNLNLFCDVDLFRLQILTDKAYFVLVNEETHKDKQLCVVAIKICV